MIRFRLKRVPAVALLVLLAGGMLGCTQKAAAHISRAEALYKEGDFVKAKLEVRNALLIQPKNARGTWLLANLLEREQDVRGTLSNLLMTIDADPGHAEARIKLGTYYLLGRQGKEAREQADAALKLAPDNAEAHFLNAKVLLLEGNNEAMWAEAEKARELNPASGQITGFIALQHARAGDLERARAVLDEGMKATDAAQVEFLRNAWISILGEAGMSDRVEAEVQRMVADYPENPAYRMALARMYVSGGRIEEAARLIEELIARDPAKAEWRIQLAEMMVSASRPQEAEAALRKAVQANPDSTLLKLTLAGFYHGQERRDEALREYEQIAASAPEKSDRLLARGRIASLQMGVDDARARQILEEMLEEDPSNVDALMMRAAYRINDGKLDDAVGDLRAVLVKEPESTRAMLMLARTHVLRGEGSLAEDFYRKLLMAEPSNPTALRELGILAANRGQTDEAQKLLREALKGSPEDAAASRSLVQTLLQQDAYEAAAAEAARIAAAGDNSGIAEYQLGKALAAQRRNEEAIAAFRASLSKNPGARPPLEALVELYSGMGRLADAETLLNERAVADPKNPYPQLLLGEVFAAGGRTADAKALYQRLIAADPALTGAYIGLAGLQPEGSDEWLRVLSDGLAANPGAPELALAVGRSYEKRKEFEQAIAVYEKSLAARDNDFVASNLAALLLDYRKDAASHQRALQLTRRFGPDAHPLSQAVLGWAYYRNGEYASAVGLLERAVAANPGLAQLHYYLGMAYLKTGNQPGARQELKQAVDLASAPDAAFFGLEEARTVLSGLPAA